MDREQPDDIGALLLGDGLELGRADRVELANEADEALDVRAAQLLVRAGEARELAQVRVPTAPVPLGQDGEVVVVLGDDPLAEPLERAPRGQSRQPVVALAKRAHELGVSLRESFGDGLLEPAEERTLLGRAPQVEQAVVRDPDEGRREDSDERLVVVAVVQQPQVPEEVDDLLLVVVVPAGRAERGQAERTKLLLVDPRVGARREEEHDLARRRLARVDELFHALRDVLGLGRTPVDARVLVARLVGDEQLDRGAERGILEAARSRERPERVAEVR